ncbi:MAG: ABC transporter ATP-binding protein [Clostridia bacterium]|nr:ABC transporter ATP-binding protein [Clostridia bacterium]MDY2714295.1 ABC transporter ATP-binding protein [Christensenellaceae bacterium]
MSVEIKGLIKNYDSTEVFGGLNLTVKANKVTVIMGASGSGKTTLLNCIAGLTPYDGEISGVNGASFVFQEDRLVPFMSVYENLDFTLQKSVNKAERKEKILAMIESVGLEDKINSVPDELSGGQKKRVSLARAFLSDSNLILMDEPLNSLDLGLKIKIAQLIETLTEKYNKTVIFVTHDIDEALTIADDIVVIGKGGIIYSHEFISSAKGRNTLSDECNAVKSKLLLMV